MLFDSIEVGWSHAVQQYWCGFVLCCSTMLKCIRVMLFDNIEVGCVMLFNGIEVVNVVLFNNIEVVSCHAVQQYWSGLVLCCSTVLTWVFAMLFNDIDSRLTSIETGWNHAVNIEAGRCRTVQRYWLGEHRTRVGYYTLFGNVNVAKDLTV